MKLTVTIDNKEVFQIAMLILAYGILFMHRKGLTNYNEFWNCLLDFYPLSIRKHLKLESQIHYFLQGFDELYDVYNIKRSFKKNENLIHFHKKTRNQILKLLERRIQYIDLHENLYKGWQLNYYNGKTQYDFDQVHDKMKDDKYNASTTSSYLIYKFFLIFSLASLILFRHGILSQENVNRFIFDFFPLPIHRENIFENYCINLLNEMKVLVRLREDYASEFQGEYVKLINRILALHEFVLWNKGAYSEKDIWKIIFTGW